MISKIFNVTYLKCTAIKIFEKHVNFLAELTMGFGSGYSNVVGETYFWLGHENNRTESCLGHENTPLLRTQGRKSVCLHTRELID